MTTFYDFDANSLTGETTSMSQYRGKVVLVVNTASECGFTPQYQGLQDLYNKYGPQGLVVLGFPCNQFGGQEPGDAQAIGAFCTQRFGVTFPLMEKVEVNGDAAHPLFRWLTEAAPGILGTRAIKWNFTKFLIDREGHVVERYAPQTSPVALETDIERALAGEMVH
jgi:glutathione peroxidase